VNENDLLNWIAEQPLGDDGRVTLGPGDDLAILDLPHRTVLAGVDQVLDGVHVDVARDGARAAARKALARSLSDIAAMAALPMACVVSVALPGQFPAEQARELYAGLRDLADAFCCPLVGGDIASWPRRDGPMQISATVLACPAGATGSIEPVRRSGGRAGQAIFVTGRLGGAWLGERRNDIHPRVREAIILALRYKLRAMIDISDGLAVDLTRLCRASGCGAEIDAAAIPIADDATAGRDIPPLAAALGDGEDYELLFTVPAGQARRLQADDKVPLPVTRIGTLIKAPQLWLIDDDGARSPLAPAGWEHT
jgi:thiamine-monophosphate kinase